mmetsp:Transcript_7242/g.19724  ORF Transcript_7242/g.19724 Transcript_7242/m.19724 type:complete len:226 (+) Transcript_7242:598-1275(+)
MRSLIPTGRRTQRAHVSDRAAEIHVPHGHSRVKEMVLMMLLRVDVEVIWSTQLGAGIPIPKTLERVNAFGLARGVCCPRLRGHDHLRRIGRVGLDADGYPVSIPIVLPTQKVWHFLWCQVRVLARLVVRVCELHLLHQPLGEHSGGHLVQSGHEGRWMCDDDRGYKLGEEELGELAELALILHQLGVLHGEGHGQARQVLDHDHFYEAPRLAREPVADPVRYLTI